MHSPIEHRSADETLRGIRETRGITPADFAGADRFVEQFLDFRSELTGVGESQAVKFGIGEIDLEEGEVVGESLGRLGHGGHAFGNSFKSAQRRAVSGADAGELFCDAGCTLAGQSEEKTALRAETLEQSGGSQAGFFGHVGEGQAEGTEAFNGARGGAEEVRVRDSAGAGRHGRRL